MSVRMGLTHVWRRSIVLLIIVAIPHCFLIAGIGIVVPHLVCRRRPIVLSIVVARARTVFILSLASLFGRTTDSTVLDLTSDPCSVVWVILRTFLPLLFLVPEVFGNFWQLLTIESVLECHILLHPFELSFNSVEFFLETPDLVQT